MMEFPFIEEILILQKETGVLKWYKDGHLGLKPV